MRLMLAGLGMVLAMPAFAQEDGMITMCLERGETQEVCDCAAGAAEEDLGSSRYATLQDVGTAFSNIYEDGGGVAPAWSAALDEVGLGRIQAGPFADAYRDAVIGCGGNG